MANQNHQFSPKQLLALLSLLVVARLASSQPNAVPYFGEGTPPDGEVFYSFPGTLFSLTFEAFDADLNGTAHGTIQTAVSEFLLSSETGSGIEQGFNPYPVTLPQWMGAEASVSMMRVNTWTNRTVLHYSFQDDSIDSFNLIPDPYRSVCFTLRDGSTANEAWELRCYRIYVQLPPHYTQGCIPGVEPKTIPTQPSTLSIFVENCPRLAMAEKTVIAVGQEFVGNIYFEDYNRDGTEVCTDCDQVVISVMADPGLPNGAALRHTVGGNQDTQSPAEYTNRMAVRYGNPLNLPVYNHLFSRQLTFKPTEEQSVTYRICVEAVDVPLGRKRNVTMGMSSAAVHQCVELAVVLPDTRVAAQAAFAPHESLPLGPLDDPDLVPTFHARVRCDHRFSVVLYEGRELEEEAVQSDARAGFEQDVYVPAATPDPAHPLPPGAGIGPVERVAVCADLSVDCAESARRLRVSHQVLSWTPQRGMEGQAWTACLLLRDQTLSAGAGEQRVCTRFRVNKCEVCTRHGDTLLSIASDFATDWLQLWGANPDIANPYDLHEVVEEQDNRLVLGPLATLPLDEAAVAVASRFRMSHKTLQLLNPELPADAAVIPAGVHVCIIPNICLQAGDINAV